MSHSVRALIVLAILVNHAFAATLWCGGDRSGPFPCPILNPDNGHFYGALLREVGGQSPSWFASQEVAAAMTFRGVHGHLATITSQAENDFLEQSPFWGQAKWIGASDADVEGEWRWVVGPETGELFWHGGPAGTAIGFADWGSGEPNGDPYEDYATMGWDNQTWNDLRADDDYWQTGAIVEFSVPEPSSYVLLTISGAALALYARRRCRS